MLLSFGKHMDALPCIYLFVSGPSKKVVVRICLYSLNNTHIYMCIKIFLKFLREKVKNKINIRSLYPTYVWKIYSIHSGCITIILVGTLYVQRDTCFHFTRCFMRLKCKYNQPKINSLGTWIFNMILSIKTNWTLHSQHAISL